MVTLRDRPNESQIKQNTGLIILMYDNAEKVCLYVRDRGRETERKRLPALASTHTHTCGGSQSCSFLQSNFGGDEMGDELLREGWG